MQKFANLPFKLIEILLVVGIAAMSLMVFMNVVLRYAFSSGIPFSVEVSRLIFVWIIFLGAIVALKEGAHLSVDALVRSLPRGPRLACFWVSRALMLWCCWLLWQGSWVQTVINWNNLAPISGISVGTMYAAGLVAAAFMGLIILGDMWRTIQDVRAGRPDAGLPREHAPGAD